MSEFLLDIIDLNEEIDYSVLSTLICSYFVVLWLVISVWVGVDAWKRYQNSNLAMVFFVLTFLLNFPILIFYFIVRPEHKPDDYDEWETGGVNVPVVNFVGKEGVDMVLQLKINPANITSSESTDMKIDVNWESQDEKKQLVSKPIKSMSNESLPGRGDREVSNVFSKWGDSVRKQIHRVKQVSADYSRRIMPKIEDLSEEKEIVSEVEDQTKSKQNKQKKLNENQKNKSSKQKKAKKKPNKKKK